MTWSVLATPAKQPWVFGSLAAMQEWKRDPQVILQLKYFGKLAKQLPRELTVHTGDEYPYLRAASSAEATRMIETLRAFLVERYPHADASVTRHAASFREGNMALVVEPVPPPMRADVLKARKKRAAWPWEDLVVWMVERGPLHLRATKDELVIVDGEKPVEPTGTATRVAELACDGLVGLWGRVDLDDIQNLAGAKRGKAPVAELYLKNAWRLRHGVYVKALRGTVRAETGGDKKARWLRFAKVRT